MKSQLFTSLAQRFFGFTTSAVVDRVDLAVSSVGDEDLSGHGALDDVRSERDVNSPAGLFNDEPLGVNDVLVVASLGGRAERTAADHAANKTRTAAPQNAVTVLCECGDGNALAFVLVDGERILMHRACEICAGTRLVTFPGELGP